MPVYKQKHLIDYVFFWLRKEADNFDYVNASCLRVLQQYMH